MSHKIKFRVYYEDTDAGGVVYHSNYLNFAERARTEWLRDVGFNQSELDVVFVVRNIEIEYLAPGRLDDELMVETSLQNIGRASITLSQDFYKDGKKITLMKVVLVTVSRNDIKPVSVPEEIKSKLVN
jgi:acyl-CoA thioester hydrolase